MLRIGYSEAEAGVVETSEARSLVATSWASVVDPHPTSLRLATLPARGRDKSCGNRIQLKRRRYPGSMISRIFAAR